MFTLLYFGVYWLFVFLTSALKAPAHSRTQVPKEGDAMVVPGAIWELGGPAQAVVGSVEAGMPGPRAGLSAVFWRGVLSCLCV